MRRASLLHVLFILAVGMGAILNFDEPRAIDYSLDKNCFKMNEQAEATFACARRFKLRKATLADLLLIPGLGDSLAIRIFTNREDLIAIADQEGLQTALETIRGIGPKTAKNLTGYLNHSEETDSKIGNHK